MLNGQHAIPARSVVSAALFGLEFVFNVVALILGSSFQAACFR